MPWSRSCIDQVADMLNYSDGGARQAHILSQLALYGGEKKEGSKSTFILCPFHAEKSPSCRIFHNNGWLKCYGCGASKSWDEVAPVLGLEPYKKDPTKAAKAHPLIFKGETTEADYDRALLASLKRKALPRNKLWRGVPTNLLIEAGCEYCTDEYGQPWILMPTYVKGRLVGFCRARMKKDTSDKKRPSYLMAGGTWYKTHGLFPFDYTMAMMKRMRTKTVVLVEGQRDVFRLLRAGIPALCIHGTNAWTLTKSRILEIAGVERTVMFMDGDDAGIEATEGTDERDSVTSLLEPYFTVPVIRLWQIKGNPYPQYSRLKTKAEKDAFKVNLWDPGSCPDWVIQTIKRKYFGGRNGVQAT